MKDQHHDDVDRADDVDGNEDDQRVDCRHHHSWHELQKQQQRQTAAVPAAVPAVDGSRFLYGALAQLSLPLPLLLQRSDTLAQHCDGTRR